MVLEKPVLKIFAIFAEKCMWESLLKEVMLCRVSAKYSFLEIHKIFPSWLTVQIWTTTCD